MTALKALFEALPIMLAVMAVILAFRAYPKQRRGTDRATMVLIILASALLVTAQTSWWHTVLVLQTSVGEDFANVLWTLFNITTTCTFVVVSAGHHDPD